MIPTIYGLTRSGNRYFYAMQNQAFAVQLLPRPIAWRKTPATSWQRTHNVPLRLDMLGLGILFLDPVAAFDWSSTEVNKLAPSTGHFEFEPDWVDAIPFTDWAEHTNWRDTISDLISEIEPKVLSKLREFSHFHWRLLEALSEWQGFKYLIDPNPALAVCLAGRVRVGAQEGDRRCRLDYKSLYRRTEKEIAAALGFGDSDAVVSCLGKLPPDACKPHDLVSLAELIENPVTRKT